MALSLFTRNSSFGRIGVFEENGQDIVYEGVLLDGIKSLDEGGEMFGMKLAVEIFGIPVGGQIHLVDLGIATVLAMKVVEPSFFLRQRMNQNQSELVCSSDELSDANFRVRE